MRFSEWKQWLCNNKAIQEKKYEGCGEIILYEPRSAFYLGMWLQTKERKIYIYGNDLGSSSLIQRTFTGDRVEGPVHQHANVELGYVVKGCARQVFSEKEYHFHEGDFWITDNNCYHSDVYFPDELFTVYISIPEMIFDVVFLESVGQSPIQQLIYSALLKQKEKRQFLRFTPRKSREKAENMMQFIVNELVNNKVGMNSIVKGMLARLLSLLSSEYDFLLANQEKIKMHHLIFNEIEKFIHNNYQTVTTKSLIAHFHYNSEFYNRIIKENTGLTYTEYLQNIRLEHAKVLLSRTELTLDEIIDRIGYQSRGYFYKIFSYHYHMTPVQYRNKMRPTNPKY